MANATQIVRVLRALQDGCRTSLEIADYGEFSVKTASAYLYSLKKKDCVRETGQVSFHRPGKLSISYELLPRGKAELRRRLNHNGRLHKKRRPS